MLLPFSSKSLKQPTPGKKPGAAIQPMLFRAGTTTVSLPFLEEEDAPAVKIKTGRRVSSARFGLTIKHVYTTG
ncbi:MAG: hypothetical protein PHQ65_13930 [Bacteroidales bacterium]|nr:hypothetical protein [Bacteroidales bacterium]